MNRCEVKYEWDLVHSYTFISADNAEEAEREIKKCLVMLFGKGVKILSVVKVW